MTSHPANVFHRSAKNAFVVHLLGLIRLISSAAILISLYEKGFANVPLDAPGLGVELNEEEIKRHLHAEDKSYFVPTPEWDEKRSHDRLWS